MLFRNKMLSLSMSLIAVIYNGVTASPVVKADIIVVRQANDQSFPEPLSDPFYVLPANISAYKPGDIVRSRPVKPWVTTPFTSSFQVLYRTTNAQGEASATVGTVWSPLIPSKPPKIFSYQYAEDSLNLNCATSFAWSNRSSSKNGFTATLEGPVVIPWALNQGMYVISPDHEGPASAYIAGRVEGPAVLDGIRATIKHQKLASKHTRAALYGYSGGSHATAWASTLSGCYAPELNIAGAAFGGTPVDPVAALEHANKSPYSALVGGGMFGLGNAYPSLNATITSELSPEGVLISQDMRDPATCLVGGPQMSKYANLDFLSIFTSEDFLQRPEVVDVLRRESLLSNVSSTQDPVPTYPRYIYHGTADKILPYNAVSAYVSQQCARGADIQFVSFAGGDHIDVAVSGIVGALRFVRQSFDGTTPKVSCGSPAPAIIPATYAARNFLGTALNSILTGIIKGLDVKIVKPETMVMA